MLFWVIRGPVVVGWGVRVEFLWVVMSLVALTLAELTAEEA